MLLAPGSTCYLVSKWHFFNYPSSALIMGTSPSVHLFIVQEEKRTKHSMLPPNSLCVSWYTVLDVLSEKLSAFFSWFGLEEYIMYVRQYYNGVVVFCARRAPALTNKLTAKRRISFWINKLFTSFLMNPYGLEVRDLQCIIIMQSSPYVYSILIKLSWRQKYTLCLRYFVTDFMMLLFSLTSVCFSHFSKAVIWTGNCFLQKNSAWGWFYSL